LPKNSTRASASRVVDIVDEKDEKDWGMAYHKVKQEVVDYKKTNRKGLWFLVILAVLFLLFAVSYVLSKAEIVIVPKTETREIDVEMKAKLPTVGSDDSFLKYYGASFSKIDSKEVPADGRKQVTKKATGTITIYNNYSKETQRLIKNTRFETRDGLIYRIDRSVDVPGKKVVNGEEILGSIEATVYADDVGEKYNIDLTDFTIPGFKSDSKRYAGFYAKSKTPMTGGYSGVTNVLSDAKQKTVRAELRANLEKLMIEEAKTKVPEGKVFPEGAYTIEYESLPIDPKSGSNVLVKEKATMNVFAFDKGDWGDNIASKTIFAKASSTDQVSLSNDGINFSWKKRPKIDSPEIDFRISGSALFTWSVDENQLALDVVGKTRSQIREEVFPKYTGLVSAEAVLSPVWMIHFPDSVDKIDIKHKVQE
jgi:hypothetical protein